uniref:Uncharacterized protein n=1 Tax=Tetradesmus obliquus TaxID=3088 RepID=A0A383VYU9_TETOB|eukprot:jgi/Sobl393_1/11848/SZX70638.1
MQQQQQQTQQQQQQQQQAPHDPARVLQRIREICLGHMRTVMSLARAGKPELVIALGAIDYETGQILPKLPSGLLTELHRYAIKQLQLSEQQKHRIADIFSVVVELMQAVAAHEVHLMQPQPGSSSSSSSGRQGDGSDSGYSRLRGSSIAAVQSQSRLQHTIQLWAGITLGQRKEYMLRMICGAFVCASLTWVQQAQLGIYCSPYAFSTTLVAEVVAEEVAAQQQQQQQQQQ